MENNILYITCNPIKIKYPCCYIQKDNDEIKVTIFFIKDKGISFHLPKNVMRLLAKRINQCLEDK